TQATLARAENLLNEGNIEAAIAEMQKLDGDAALAAAPWMSKAQGALAARQISAMLGNTISAAAAGKNTPYDFGKNETIIPPCCALFGCSFNSRLFSPSPYG